MAFNVIFKVLAQIEVAEAYQWYRQPDIQMGDAFLFELERTSSFLASNPYLYPKVEQDLRRAHLNRFPYALFYVIDGETVNVLSCFHQHRDPESRGDLLGREG
jgi:plasmid stabilization system protein ParE